jgi:glycosyltransferase involved in cell wall biosynthesis
MRLHYLSKSLIPSAHANSIQVMKMCAAFAQCGNAVTLFATRAQDACEDIFAYYGVAESFSLRFDYPEPKRKEKPYFGSRYRWSLAREFRRRPPDLFYGRDIFRLLAAADLGRPVVCEVHDVPNERDRFRRLIEHPTLTGIVAITHALKEDLKNAYPTIPSEKIMVFPDAADPPPDGLEAATLRSSRLGQFNICYTGNLYPGKGMEVLSQLPLMCDWADFHVVGGTDDEVGHWRAKLSSFPNIFFYGRKEPRAVASYIKAADVALAPYQQRVEAQGGGEIGRWMSPLKVFEYMALAKPIVASDVPALREVLSEGGTAVLVPPDDIDAWADALRALFRGPDRRLALGNRAYAAFNDRFTWISRSQKILDSCSALVDRRKGSSTWLSRAREWHPFHSEGGST